MTGFQRLCLATTALVFVLIVIGGTVRATDSGLGCPDWPRCHGSFIPKVEKHTLIEYSHRFTASVAGLMVFAVAAWAWKSYRNVKSVFYPAVATFVLVLVQGGLGGLTVVHELPPEIVTVHLATAMTLFALLILITVATFANARPLPRLDVPPNLAGVALVVAALTLAVMLVGAYVAGAGYSLACSGWPLCNGAVLPDTSAESVRLVLIHRILAALLGLAAVAFAAWAWRHRAPSPLTANLAGAALVVYIAQVLVGAANIWSQIADLAQIAHLAVGTVLWGILAYLSIRLYDLPRLLEARPGARPAGRRLAKVTR